MLTKYKHGKLGTLVFSLKELETYLNSHISKTESEVVDKLSARAQVVWKEAEQIEGKLSWTVMKYMVACAKIGGNSSCYMTVNA